ncbi:serine/threonine-protein kinase [Mycobacterium sp. 050134]|uniref:serine/threonine-protein kinase n=1 Tax=Mycobacterium sp. 050134 TaxID=3096111 RepID=UPI002ED9AEB5
MALSIGSVVAGYRIEGVLGAGGMGTVYLARHPTLPRSDALKVLSAELSHDDQFRRRFTREADLAATLSHPNIVTVFNRGETEDGQLWIAMQYIEGTAANDLDAANLTPARVVRIVTDVGKALDYAHSRRVLHRDVKPGNFLVARPGAGEQERVLLADFGIARALDDATTLTATGSLVFTAAYASPEAVEGQAVDHRADIYSLGCSLFRLLTGRTPYEDFHGLPAMLMAHVMKPVPRPSQYVIGLPPAVDDVVARAMAKNPADRFFSAGEMADATTAALTGLPPERLRARASQTANWTSPPLSYPPTPPYPGYGPYVGPPTPGLSVPQQFPRGPLAGAASPRRRRRKPALILGALGTVIAVAAAVGVYLAGRHHTGELPPYQPQTLNAQFGNVQLQHRPMAVAALGPGDADAVLSLGVQPVAISGIQGGMPSWLQPQVHSSTPVLGLPDPGAVAAAKPDLIVDTGEIDKPTYDKLAAIAPTLTRPADTTQNWVWQTQLTWIATALGRANAAKTMLADAASQQTALRSQHPAFSGKSIAVVDISDSAVTVAQRVSPPTNYVEGLGFTYNQHYRRAAPGDPPAVPLNVDTSFFWVENTDVMVLLRTDSAAGGGGYAGLPAPFVGYHGILVIVDDPASISALNTGGPAATAYLNTALVNKLANQIH